MCRGEEVSKQTARSNTKNSGMWISCKVYKIEPMLLKDFCQLEITIKIIAILSMLSKDSNSIIHEKQENGLLLHILTEGVMAMISFFNIA